MMSLPAQHGNEDHEALGRQLRSYVKWGRDCGAAAICGGVAVGFGLILSGTPIRRDVYVPLIIAYGMLMVIAALCWALGMRAVGKAQFSVVVNAVAPAVLIILVGLSNVSGGKWPLKPYTGRWWEVVALAFSVALGGAYRRRNADDALDVLEAPRS